MTASDTMKAVVLEPSGRLADAVLPRPVPGPRDLLVRVQAVSVNPVDTKQQPGDAPRVLGWDVAGVVEAVGPECRLFRPGDEVYYAGDITRPGGFSEYHVVDERIVGRKPKRLSFAEAAALPLTSLTAWEGMFERLGLDTDDNQGRPILIIGAAGGVGSIATQLARRAGLTVIGTASRPESRAWVLHHGAHHVIDHTKAFLPQLQALGFPAVDTIFCLNVVHPHWDAMMDALAPLGKVCTILPPFAPVDFRKLFDKSATWCTEAMFARPKHRFDMEAQHRILTRLAEFVDKGEIRSTLREHFGLITAANLEKAFAQIQSGRTIGKLVLESFA
ncbi:oxidoreductase [Alicyclobacillus cellulosilyticus]|uniref:Zinc-type alcohol dehydrogenase-like protein n=1 Tax=Alicyclobacillus cellulosilyticus TaxID=1003997 RepID=A0A917K671_9BACL|nr:zinc-binding alcohol dehydrogenase family protein [Alicyclobacillus cellulosilyticus]GGJ02541.1 oxidoreductase [Alicyclobacillus cellulosilyticus]